MKKIRGLRTMCEQLNDAQISQEGLNRLMGSLGRSVGSNGLFFIRKIYTIGELINAIEKIVATFPGIHTACGLSNISYGLPGRKFLNLVFMTMAIAKGLDGAIINPLDSQKNGWI